MKSERRKDKKSGENKRRREMNILGRKEDLIFVTGRFSRLSNQSAMVDPFEIAVAFVHSSMPRSLNQLLQELNQELAGA